MNTNLKSLIVLGSATLYMLAASGAQAAVISAPDPTLNLVFDTDGSTSSTAVDSTGTVSTRGLGIGYDPANFGNKFVVAKTAATAQSVYNPLITDSSAAGSFTTITAGSSFQLGLHAYGLNRADSTQPVTLFASLFAYDPNAAAGTVPITGSAIFSNLPVQVLDSADTTDHTYFSNTIQLANSINANTEYVLAVDGGPAGGASPTDFGTADRSFFSTSGLPSADSGIYQNYFLTNTNNGDQGGTAYQTASGGITQPLGYRFYSASTVTAAPEPSARAACGFFAFGLGGMLIAARKRNAGVSSAS